MIKGYINSIVSKHFFGWALGENIHGDETPNFYNLINDKLEDLTRSGNLPIFAGFYTEYVDENEVHKKPDNKFVIQNCL